MHLENLINTRIQELTEYLQTDYCKTCKHIIENSLVLNIAIAKYFGFYERK